MPKLQPYSDSPVFTGAPSEPNGDEGRNASHPYIGNFHKTLPCDAFGEVEAAAYQALVAAASEPPTASFEAVPLRNPAQHVFNHPPLSPADLLVSPQAGFSTESLGPDPAALEMIAAPRVDGISTAAEMAELYWMALHRDVPLRNLSGSNEALQAIADLAPLFDAGVGGAGTDPGALRLGVDLPTAGGNLHLTGQTLYRSGLPGEDLGPLVSQFFLHDVPYGTQLIEQKQFPYRRGADYLFDHASWLRAQETGYDVEGDPYPRSNDENDNPYVLEAGRARIRTMRDLARFVHRDALHQAYFNAALLLLAWGADADPGNPYTKYTRQRGFATLGGPHLLALVSEVASRALKVVWRQKWSVHRRLRPEAYGGLLHMQRVGHSGVKKAYGLPPEAWGSVAARQVHATYGGYFLPMAFTSGSPVHPAYGAGHATVAGACVTILKAWFDTSPVVTIASILDRSKPGHPATRAPVRPVNTPMIGSDYVDPLPDAEAASLTLEGELNKLASNVAMGRSMGGVHWRSDNTRSLRLGEAIATIILKRTVTDYAETAPDGTPLRWQYRSFDGHDVVIRNDAGTGIVELDAVLSDFYDAF